MLFAFLAVALWYVILSKLKPPSTPAGFLKALLISFGGFGVGWILYGIINVSFFYLTGMPPDGSTVFVNGNIAGFFSAIASYKSARSIPE